MNPDTNETRTVPKSEAQPNWAAIGLFVAVVLIVVMTWFLWDGVFAEAWEHYHDPNTKDPVPKTEALRNLTWSMGTIGAVFAGFIGLIMAGFRTQALYRQAKVAETDSKFAEKKHQSEAFATAIEQLGNEDSFAVRLGAVYALEALAKSSKELHGPIFETLCAYVREKYPASYVRPSSDVRATLQAIISVLGRRNLDHDPRRFRIDLRRTDLSGVDFRKGHFEGADFRDAVLKGADLRGAYMNFNTRLDVGTAFHRANLENANLKGANLENAKARGAQFKGAIFMGTNVDNADFQGAKGIPAQPDEAFRATVQNADTAQWPGDDDEKAWDRGE